MITTMIMNIKSRAMKNWIILMLPVALFMACNTASDREHEEGGHEHGQGNEARISSVVRTNKAELFVEYPALVKGHTSSFNAHFTRLNGYQPVKKGTVTVSMIKGNKGIRHTVDTPLSPGIFSPALQPQDTGEYQLYFDVKAAGLDERFHVENVQVFPNDEKAAEALEHQGRTEPDISFTKEQAWQIDFQLARVKKDTVYGLIKAAGKWIREPGTQRTLNAPAEGNVLYKVPGLVAGAPVSKGQALMRISGKDLNVSSIETEVHKAKAAFEQAESAYNRKKKLHKLGVAPKSELEEAKKRFEVTKADYQQLLKNYGANGVAVRAPFDGYVKRIFADNGAFAPTGTPLLTIGSARTRMIKLHVPPDKRHLISQTEKVWVMKEGKAISARGRVVSMGQSVSAENPMLPVFIKVETSQNPVEGSLAEVQLGYNPGKSGIVIPKSALLEDFGTYKVVVQTGGEGYTMQPVKIGAFNGNRVAVTHGLQPDDWIVSRGAYQVKMASMAGAVGHGHAH